MRALLLVRAAGLGRTPNPAVLGRAQGVLKLVALVGLFVAAAVLGIARASPEGSAGPELGPGFVTGTLDSSAGFVTSLASGPDGRLYVATLSEISVLTLDSTGTQIEDTEVIASDLSYVLGLAFDPSAPGEPVTVYASRLDLEADAGLGGTISTFTAPDWTREDVITGLPDWRSLQHLTNGIAFDQGGALFIAQASSLYDAPLSGAVLTADIHDTSFDGDMTYRPSGPVVSNNVAVVSGDVRVLSPGLRNPYDLVVHSNGKIYATDNGGIGPDEVNLIEEGQYYGHPNLNRGRQDSRQLIFHPGDEPGNEEYSAPILTECGLCQGIAEYTSNANDGVFKGDLIAAGFSSGNVWRLQLSKDGGAIDDASVLATVPDALDLTVGPGGIIYVGGGDGLFYLQPTVPGFDTPTPTWVATATPTVTATPSATATSSPTVTVEPAPTLTPAPRPTGDVSCDGRTDSRDAALVLQLTVGLVARLPCPGRR